MLIYTSLLNVSKPTSNKTDHTQLKVPRPPQVFSIPETSHEEIVEALSKMSTHFKQSREFQVEYADYMKNNRS
ncbi:DUF6022 family protein [Thermoactinomyces sp. DSM 45892]|uniref:DUF6022 family protein n=1 Tax=Thermoactinomyces sp. DSM 45892 TaxID=1882753 RepID=UPI003519BA0C